MAEKCGRKACGRPLEDGKYLWGEDGRKYRSCAECHNDEFPVEELEESAQLECETCGGEGFIEVDNRSSCGVPISECCGGCYDSEPCPDCGKEEPEPDWDAIRKDREDLEIEKNAEVDWDAPY